MTCQSPLDGSPQGIGRVADLEDPICLQECCELVKAKYELEAVKVFGDPSAEIRRVAISPGAGKSMVSAAFAAHADVLITGDIDHHTGIDAVAQGLMIIDGGHYGIEKIFVPDVAAFLREKCQAIDVVESTFGKEYFDHIQGQSGEFPKKPDPEGLLWILDKLGVSPEEGIYIGDSDVDMKTGKAAGMFTVGAEWGFRTKELLVETGADATIAHAEELLNYL